MGCCECETVHERNVNAAKSILAAGHRRLAAGLHVRQDGESVNKMLFVNVESMMFRIFDEAFFRRSEIPSRHY